MGNEQGATASSSIAQGHVGISLARLFFSRVPATKPRDLQGQEIISRTSSIINIWNPIVTPLLDKELCKCCHSSVVLRAELNLLTGLSVCLHFFRITSHSIGQILFSAHALSQLPLPGLKTVPGDGLETSAIVSSCSSQGCRWFWVNPFQNVLICFL